MIMLFSVLAIFLGLLLSNSNPATGPLEEVKGTVEALRSIVNDPVLKGESRKKEKQGRIRALILERMDLAEKAKRS